MSKVISFRLDENNPREVRALQNLKAWEEKGFSVRYILTEALGQLEPDNPQCSDKSDPQPGFNDLIIRLEHILEHLENGVSSDKSKEDMNKLELRTEFLASIKKSARQGMKLDN